MFAEVAHSEIQKLKEYYDGLSTIQKNYFFPGQLKRALESYTAYENNGAAVYVALFNTSWFLKHRPFFSFLSKFSTSDQNPVAQSFRLAHGLYGLNNNNRPTKCNNILNDINYLTPYKTNWFSHLFFPKELSDALDNFDKDQDFLSLCKALAKNTNTWFFPTLNLFGQTQLMQAYRKFEAGLGKSVAASDKSYVFKQIASSDTPLEQLEIMIQAHRKFEAGLGKSVAASDKSYVFKQIASSDAPLEQLEIITRYYYSLNKDGAVIDQNAMNLCLEWLEKYPTLKIQDLLELGKNASDATISALLELGDDKKSDAIQGLIRLPKELLNDSICIDAIIDHAQPDHAAIIIHQFHENNLFDTEFDKAFCLEFLKQNQSIQPEDFGNAVLTALQLILPKLKRDVRFTVQEKRSIVEYSKSLFNTLTNTLWNAVPNDLLYKSYQDLIKICEINASEDLMSEIILYLLTIPVVFNNVKIHLSDKYDQYTADQIDKIISEGNNPQLIYNALPHLIRRNTDEANTTVLNLLNNFSFGKENAAKKGQLTDKEILDSAKKYNQSLYNSIQDLQKSNDYYAILGVSSTATVDEIKKAYRAKVLKFHPDKTVSLNENEKKIAEAKFLEIKIAYETLNNDEKRKLYDRGPSAAVVGRGTNDYIDKKNGLKAKITYILYNNYPADLFIDKNTLMLFLTNFSSDVDKFNEMAKKNEEYKKVAVKINNLYTILSENMDVLNEKNPLTASALKALNACKQSIFDAEQDGGITIPQNSSITFFKEYNIMNENNIIPQLKSNIDWYIEQINHEESISNVFKPKPSSPK